MNNYNKILFNLFKFLFMFGLPFIIVFIIIAAIASPAIWIGNMLGNNTMDDTDYKYEGNFQKEIDAYSYAHHVALKSDQMMACTLEVDDPKKCFDYVDENGIFDETRLKSEDASIYQEYLKNINEYNGILADHLYDKYHIVGKYKKSIREVIEKEYIWKDDPKIYDGKCESSDTVRCEILKEDRYVDQFNRPSDGQIITRYGFYTKGENINTFTAGFNPYSEFNGNPIAITNGSISEFTNNKIIIDKYFDDNHLQFIYEGRFDRVLEDNNCEPQDLLAYTDINYGYFKFIAYLNGQYINPAVFYQTEIAMGEDQDGTTVPNQAEEGYRAYITTQVEPDMNLWDKVSFKQPFDECVITQCAEVLGVGDGGNKHTALDMISGTERGNLPLPSTIDGKVVEVGYGSISGNFVTVEDEETGVRVNYNHLQYRSKYNLNDKVKQGDILGNMGDTGKSFGVHLHMNVYQPMNADRTKYGWVNPMFLMTNFKYASGCSPCSY